MSDELELGLFPLEIALLPGEAAPLHIFEPRYRELVADCVLGDRPFALVLTRAGALARVSCATRVERLVRRFADGRLQIEVRGVERVELVEETAGHGYRSARMRPLPDREDPPGDAPAVAALAEKVVARFRALAAQVAGAPADPPSRPGVPVSYAVAGAVTLPVEVTQELLEMRSEHERLERLHELLADASVAVDRERIAAARAGRNGKVIAP